jgi:hypothetical protein
MANAPCIKPAAPQPATARPKMNASEDGAVAQSVEPTMAPVSILCHERTTHLTFEYGDRDEVHKLCVDDLVQLPAGWLQGCKGEQICTSIPSEIFKSMEIGGDDGEGSVDDRGVEGDEEGA